MIRCINPDIINLLFDKQPKVFDDKSGVYVGLTDFVQLFGEMYTLMEIGQSVQNNFQIKETIRDF